MKEKTKYKAWSILRQDWIYTSAYSKPQAAELIRRRVQKLTGKFDPFYDVIKVS